jgi:hypothetical protein
MYPTHIFSIFFVRTARCAELGFRAPCGHFCPEQENPGPPSSENRKNSVPPPDPFVCFGSSGMVSLLSEEIRKSVFIGTMFRVRSSSSRKTWGSSRRAVKEVGEDGWKMNEESETGRVGGRMREKFSCWRLAWLLEGRWVKEMAGGRTRGRPKEMVVLGLKRCIFAKISLQNLESFSFIALDNIQICKHIDAFLRDFHRHLHNRKFRFKGRRLFHFAKWKISEFADLYANFCKNIIIGFVNILFAFFYSTKLKIFELANIISKSSRFLQITGMNKDRIYSHEFYSVNRT